MSRITSSAWREADKAGCVLTNLKINRSDIDIGNVDPVIRQKAWPK